MIDALEEHSRVRETLAGELGDILSTEVEVF